jgi:hypothetical protein
MAWPRPRPLGCEFTLRRRIVRHLIRARGSSLERKNLPPKRAGLSQCAICGVGREKNSLNKASESEDSKTPA